MKTPVKLLLLTATVVATAWLVAQEGPPPRAGGRRPPAPAIVGALDANHDGVIDADEIANAAAVLKTLDKNGDGQLTPDEFMGPRPGGPGTCGENRPPGGPDEQPPQP